ncbi:hypothetical protein GCM10011341_16020 [Frigidibacter albus]|nr:hypothetical protein GCM10011341_16020 [Frigidibacter albus]
MRKPIPEFVRVPKPGIAAETQSIFPFAFSGALSGPQEAISFKQSYDWEASQIVRIYFVEKFRH